MSQIYYTLLTVLGAAELVNAEVGGVTVPLTHLAIGDGNGNPVIPSESMTALVREVHRVPITSITADANNPSRLIIEAVIPATVGGWVVREVGLIGGAGAGNKLLAIGNFPASEKPMLAEGSGRDMALRMIISAGNASVVQLTIDPSVVVATNQAISNAVASHEIKADPHAGQYITTGQRGAANGVAPLGADNLVPLANLPPAIATDAELAASLAAHVDPAGHPHLQYITQSDLDAIPKSSGALIFEFNNLV